MAGEPSALREAGFRDSARRAPEALVAVAISRGPLASTAFAEEGSRAFERGATAYRPGEVRRHPLARWAWIAAGSAAALLATLGADAAAGGGSAGVLGALALLGALFFPRARARPLGAHRVRADLLAASGPEPPRPQAGLRPAGVDVLPERARPRAPRHRRRTDRGRLRTIRPSWPSRCPWC
ncbi:MAG: hypothetical protein M5U28_36900 [Sandaracinaceae bacterium]|nr:hypothetical protein [Sandaracinaceae bacterium]